MQTVRVLYRLEILLGPLQNQARQVVQQTRYAGCNSRWQETHPEQGLLQSIGNVIGVDQQVEDRTGSVAAAMSRSATVDHFIRPMFPFSRTDDSPFHQVSIKVGASD